LNESCIVFLFSVSMCCASSEERVRFCLATLIGYSSRERRQLDAIRGTHCAPQPTPSPPKSFHPCVSAVTMLCGWQYCYTTW